MTSASRTLSFPHFQAPPVTSFGAPLLLAWFSFPLPINRWLSLPHCSPTTQNPFLNENSDPADPLLRKISTMACTQCIVLRDRRFPGVISKASPSWYNAPSLTLPLFFYFLILCFCHFPSSEFPYYHSKILADFQGIFQFSSSYKKYFFSHQCILRKFLAYRKVKRIVLRIPICPTLFLLWTLNCICFITYLIIHPSFHPSYFLCISKWIAEFSTFLPKYCSGISLARVQHLFMVSFGDKICMQWNAHI